MRKILLALLLTGSATLLALTASPVAQEIPSIPSPTPEVQYPNNTTQPVNCFDYYKFGSVYASLETKNYTNVSGTKINFFGEIKNENSYPIVNGKLFVKIMRQNDTYEKTGGQDEVDSFIVKDNISIKANSSIPVNFDWQIPAYALSGEYQASTYFLVDNSFNMSGLSFTTDIVGGVAKFAVQGEQKTTVFFDRTKIKLNNNPYYTVAFNPSVQEDESANITLTLTNTTKETQRVPVTLDLYVWDAQSQKNLLKQDTQTFLLNPNSSLEAPYTVTDTAHSVYFLQAKAQYQDTKSEVSVRFGRQNKQEPRINFTTLTTYPLEKGKENNLLTCVHNTNKNDADYGKVITTIYNHTGKQIHQSHYEGGITGAIQGMNYKFIPQANYKDLTIETKIYDKVGAITNESKLTYTCSELSDNCTEPQIVFDTKTISKTLLTLLGIVLLLIFTKKYLKNKNIITSLLILCTIGVMMMPEEVEAKSAAWGYTYDYGLAPNWATDLLKCMNCGYGGMPISGGILNGPYMQVTYHASVFKKEGETETLLNEGNTVNVGDVLKFYNSVGNWLDVFWNGTGYEYDTPYGDWVPNADYVMPTNQNQIWNMWVPGYDPGDGIISSVFAFFSVHPPVFSITQTDNLSCGPLTNNYIECTVLNPNTGNTDPVSISPVFNYGQTYGKFYFPPLDEWGNFAWGFDYSRDVGRVVTRDPYWGNGIIGGIYTQNIDAVLIPFGLNIQPVDACATNTPPTAPSITLTPVTVTVGQNTSITFTSTDAQNNPITYQIDWGDGILTTVTSPLVKSWTTTGTKTLKVRALDDCGQSAWTTKTIVVSALPVLDPLTVTADPTCGSVVLNWNDNTATSYQVFRKEGTGSYSAVSPILTTRTFTDTTGTDGHTYMYRIWSSKGVTERYSNEIASTPTCPDMCANIEDTQTIVPAGLHQDTARNCVCGG